MDDRTEEIDDVIKTADDQRHKVSMDKKDVMERIWQLLS